MPDDLGRKHTPARSTAAVLAAWTLLAGFGGVAQARGLDPGGDGTASAAVVQTVSGLVPGVIGSGRGLRSKVAQARAAVVQLDREARTAQTQSPAGASVLAGLRQLLTSPAPVGGNRSLLAQLDALDKELASGLAGAGREPARCGPETLRHLPRSIGARKQVAAAGGRAAAVRSDADRYLKSGDLQLGSLVAFLATKKDPSVPAVQRFRAEYRQGLASVSSGDRKSVV